MYPVILLAQAWAVQLVQRVGLWVVPPRFAPRLFAEETHHDSTIVQIDYYDGGHVKARLLESSDRGFRVRSSDVAHDYYLRLDNARQFNISCASPPTNTSAASGVLVLRGGRLRGRVVESVFDGHLRWNPVFSEDVIPVTLGSRGEQHDTHWHIAFAPDTTAPWSSLPRTRCAGSSR